MLLLRAVLLELIVCFHVVGGAVIFRRLFPRESPWLALFVPTLLVMMVCNFIEHVIPLTHLSLLLPFTVAGILWATLRPGYSWKGLQLPVTLFLLLFTWAFFLKCLNPEITNNTEGVADMARVLDFCLGGTLPPIDSWCPPYDHSGYYTFQHYGASLLKRYFILDIGTGYNMGYTLLNTLTLLAGTGAAYLISGRRLWVGLFIMIVLLANFSGSYLFIYLDFLRQYLFHGNHNAVLDSRLAIDIGDAWGDPGRNNIFAWIFQPIHKAHPEYVNPPVLRLFTPAFNTYFPEFHANLGGHFMTLLTLLAANEANRSERSNWPWICLLAIPCLTIITAVWFFIVVTVLAAGGLVALLIAGRRPENWRIVIAGGILANILIWPSIDALIGGSYPVIFQCNPWLNYTPFWEFIIQWWPAVIPWFLLLFLIRRQSWLVCWIMLALPLLLIFVEVFSFSDRGLTVEKMWGAVYGAALVTFLPLVFIERHLLYRFATVAFIFLSLVFFGSWARISIADYSPGDLLHLRGDTVLQNDPQKKRILQVLNRLHATTVLSGRSQWSYNQGPSLVDFSENRCFIAWFYQEYQCGHGGEAEYRDQMSNDFFDGKMTDPLPFLRLNDIAAVMIFPDEQPKDCIPDDILTQLKAQLAPEFYYIDCHEGGEHNAGVFLRLPGTLLQSANAGGAVQLPPRPATP